MTMNNFFIQATPSTPEVDFRFDQHFLSLKGESYPENAAAYWGPTLAILRDYLDQKQCEQPVVLNVALTYFNSSSTKMLFSLFELLNGKAKKSCPVVLNWYHDPDDETIYEFGQELNEDFTDITFNSIAIES